MNDTGFLCNSRTRRSTQNPRRNSVSSTVLTKASTSNIFFRFPGQEHVAGNTKIPSVIYYDKYGRVMAAGAETENASVQAQAEDEAWIKAELYVEKTSFLLTHSPSSQLQTPSPTTHNAAKHERHAPLPTPKAQNARSRIRRLPSLPLPLHPLLHIRHTRKRPVPLHLRRARHTVRPQPPKRLGGATADTHAHRGRVRRLGPRHR